MLINEKIDNFSDVIFKNYIGEDSIIYIFIYNINKEYFEYNGKKIPKTKLTKPFKLKSTCLEEDLMCYIRNILS
jgi:hypothetical protein